MQVVVVLAHNQDICIIMSRFLIANSELLVCGLFFKQSNLAHGLSTQGGREAHAIKDFAKYDEETFFRDYPSFLMKKLPLKPCAPLKF